MMKPLVAFLCVLFLVLMVTAQASAETYRIGVSIRETSRDTGLTHADIRLKDRTKAALNLYKEKLEETLGLQGHKHKIELVYGDLEVHKNAQVLAVIGQLFSQEVLDEAANYEKAGIVYITPSGSSPDVTAGKQWVFSMIYNDVQQAQMIANFVNHVLHCKNSVVAVYKDNSYGRPLKEEFCSRLLSPCKCEPITYGKESFQKFIEKGLVPALEKTKHDAIVFFTYPQRGMEMIEELSKIAIKKPIICPESFYKEESFPDSLKDSYSHIYVATPFVSEFGTKAASELMHSFEQRNGERLTLYPLLACEALDLVVQAAVAAGSGADSEKVKHFLDRMKSLATAKEGISGPLFFDHNVVNRPVIIAIASKNGGIRPMSVQIQQTQVLEGTSAKRIAEMVQSGKIFEINSGAGRQYFKIIPVIYTRMLIRRLTNFDPEHKTMDIHYNVYLTWPPEVYGEKSRLNVEPVDLIAPEIVSKPVEKGMTGGYRYYPDYPDTGLHSHECYSRKASVHWDGNLDSFPFDVHRINMQMKLYGKNASDVILAVDAQTEPGKKSNPEVDSQFEFIASSIGPYTYLSKLPYALTDPVTGKEMYYYVSIYETEFTLRRNFWWFHLALLLLPLGLLVVWYVFWRAEVPIPVGTVPGGIAFSLLVGLTGWCMSQYKIAPLSLLNISFMICYIIVLGPWIPYAVLKRRSDQRRVRHRLRVAFGIAIVIVTVYLVFVLRAFIQWQSAE